MLNLNTEFLMSFMTFFIYLDALVAVLKAIKKLVQKQHYQDTLMYNTMLKYKQNRKEQPAYENFQDSALPKGV